MTESGQRSGALFLICARAPVAGMTKTRLGAAIGDEQAAILYRAFLTDLAARFTVRAAADAGYDLGWAFTPAETDFAGLIAGLAPGEPIAGAQFVPQMGEGWDVRQVNLLRWGYDHGYERTVIVASDSPQLPLNVATDAFQVLDDRDMVLGRVRDGGYYLIGNRGFHDVLTGTPMSTASAADAVMQRATAMGLTMGELPESFDVDIKDDLQALGEALSPAGKDAPATWAALNDLGLINGEHGSERKRAKPVLVGEGYAT